MPPEPLSQTDWQQTPPAVQTYLLNLHQRLAQLQQQIEQLQKRSKRTLTPEISVCRVSSLPPNDVTSRRKVAYIRQFMPTGAELEMKTACRKRR